MGKRVFAGGIAGELRKPGATSQSRPDVSGRDAVNVTIFRYLPAQALMK